MADEIISVVLWGASEANQSLVRLGECDILDIKIGGLSLLNFLDGMIGKELTATLGVYPYFRRLSRCRRTGLFFVAVSATATSRLLGYFEVPRDKIEALLEQAGFDPDSRRLCVGGPDAPSPVICSQAEIARFIRKSERTAGLLGKLQKDGIFERFERIRKGLYKIWFANPNRHAEALRHVENRRKS
jgi:hypothetical protein